MNRNQYSRNYQPPPPEEQRKKNYQQNNKRPQQYQKKDDNPLFSNNFINFLGLIAKNVGQLGIAALIFGLVFGLLVVDIFMGGVALSLAFVHDIPFRDGTISAGFIAGAISWVTSGIQTFLLVLWPMNRMRIKDWEKWLLIGIIILDSVIDMSGIAYFLNGGEHGIFYGLNMVDWMILVLVTGICVFSENIIVLLARLQTNGLTFKKLINGLRNK